MDNTQQEKFFIVFNDLREILTRSNNIGQANVIGELLNLLKGDIEVFKNKINSVDMWGGSGAVWEVYIDDKEDAAFFERRMIELIDLMEKYDLTKRRIKANRGLDKK